MVQGHDGAGRKLQGRDIPTGQGAGRSRQQEPDGEGRRLEQAAAVVQGCGGPTGQGAGLEQDAAARHDSGGVGRGGLSG